jgi:hypothetical protein
MVFGDELWRSYTRIANTGLVESMPNWGNCTFAEYYAKKVGESLSGEILKRCDENCFDFIPTLKMNKNTAGYLKHKKCSTP